MGPQCGHRDTGSPGAQLREVRLSAPGCPSGEGRELGEQEGLRGGEKEVSVRIPLPSSNCHHVPLFAQESTTAPCGIKTKFFCSAFKTLYILGPPHLPYTHPSPEKN